jgi:hypothetical protein
MLFQKNIVKKYLAALPHDETEQAWQQYKSYFLNPAIQANILQSKEEQFQEGFLRELFVKVLGYTLNPSPDYNLITEQKNESNSKKADGAIIVDGTVVGVIELKDHKTTDLAKIEQQAFGYKSQNQNAVYVIISNFEKLRFYIDNAVEHIEFDLFHLSEEEFRTLWLCLAYNSIAANLPKRIKNESVSNEDSITSSLYKDYSQFKRVLFADIVEHNPTYDKLLLFKKTQKLLDRLLFIFFAEDCGLLPPNSMMQIIDQWEKLKEMDEYRPFYDRVKKYFGYMNTGFKGQKYEIFAYNGGLFKPDEVLDNIIISDEPLVEHTKRLSAYDFESEVDVNILGHIFENSLSEIEEVTQQINGGEASQTSKRKKDGVFYTPQYITKYIVENTVGRLCTEKKSKLSIIEAEYFSDQKRPKPIRKRLMEQLQQYREWLLQITICDPACGSGAFLNAALQFLINEHKLIDEMEAKVSGESIVFPNIENSILENNLFGVDINEESVEIAQLALWLRTAKPHRKLNTLNQNIKCGNSLISDPAIAGDKAFNWQKEFPKVFEKGGFDVVIGNPPYFNIQTLGAKSKYVEYIQKEYSEIWQDKSDILFYFIYKALQISKGDVGLIISNAFLFSDKARKLRNHIIDDGRLSKIVNFERYMVFADASITSCITIFNKQHNGVNAFVLKEKDYIVEDVINYISNEQNSFSVNIDRDNVFALVDNKISLLNKKIDSNWKELRNILKVGKGMETAANDVFCFSEYPSQFPKEYIKRRMCGEIISRYNLHSKEEYMLYFEDAKNFEDLPVSIQEHLLANKETLANRATCKNEGRIWWRYSRPMHKEYYCYDKIWCSYRAKSNEFVLDESNNYIGLTNTTVIFGTNPKYSLKYILALLNSSLLNFRYKSIGKQTGSGVFEYFEVGVGSLPIPECADQQPFIDLADTMLSLNAQLQQKRSRFLRRLQENFEDVKITGTLETFDTLSFADFVKELKKQKIKLTLSQQDEWEEYFDQYKSECNSISEQIAESDKKIDRMVYELYGLTEEEIKVVEGES